MKVSKGNNLISKSRAFHNVGAAYTKDLSKNELAHVLLIGGTHNKQGSKVARVRIVVLLTLSLIKSHKYSGAVLLKEVVTDEGDLAQRFQTGVWNDERSTSAQGDLVVE